MLPSSWMKFRFAFAGPHLGRVLLAQVAQGLDVLVAEQGVVVEVDLGVERDHVPLLGDRQRVDLGQRRVLLQEDPGQRRHDLLGLRDLVAGEARLERQPAGLERLQARLRGDGHFDDLLRRLVGDLLDVHPPSALAISTGMPRSRSRTMPK